MVHLDGEAGDDLANRGHLSREPEQCRYVEKCPGERGQQGQRPDMGLSWVYSVVSKGAAQKGECQR